MMQDEERRAFHRKRRKQQRFQELRQILLAELASILKIGKQQGEIRTDIPLEALASVLLGMLRTRGKTHLSSLRDQLDINSVVDLFFNGARK